MAHVQKFTRGNLNGLSIHLDRKTDHHSNEEIDPTKTYLNYDLCQKEGDTLSRLNDRLKEVYCMKRDDVKVGCSWIVTLPKNLKEQTESDQQAFFEKTYAFLSERYGGEKNVLSAQVHLDETTPHLHFVFMPVVWDEKKQREKISAKEVLNRNDLQNFHGELDTFLKKELPTIYKDGILNGETIELDSVKEIKKYAKQIQEKKDDLSKELKLFSEPKKVFEQVEKASKKSLFGDKVTLPYNEFEKLKNLSLSGIKLNNQLNQVSEASKKDLTVLKKDVDLVEQEKTELKGQLQQANQRVDEATEKVTYYLDTLENTLKTGQKFKDQAIIYKSILKDAKVPFQISEMEKQGRLILSKVENGRMPEDEKKAKKWISVLEQNKEAGTIPLNRLESILEVLKAFLEKLLNKELTFSLDGLKSRDTELKQTQKPTHSNSMNRGR
ncbi:Plasmid recombination enzyme [Carnobacterium iners]|uniref:Plasmid recombination enzyme n=1 Tax=Carnobacterium iners TaxID=1073423 RepID=A0A1X7NU77_9LACT|nr:MobV family relaxase [Carnobacterium iners]SMH41739.1 Plasmid recombination enzyme [Carnobacterium iners]SMH41780.1 Plasmid recombination enzyme [Carnobacterium iners]